MRRARTDSCPLDPQLFPIITWLPNYNLTWFVGDLISGITVGLVLVPQSMSYAKLANLEPQYGLYSSFIGVVRHLFSLDIVRRLS